MLNTQAQHALLTTGGFAIALARRIKEYKETQKSSNAIEQHRQLNTYFLHKLSTQLAKTRSVVVVETLNVRGMM